MKTKNGGDWAKNSPYGFYFDFIAPKADRYKILLECINSLNLNSAVIPVAGNRHIFIFPSGQKSLRSAGGIFPFRNQSPYLFSAHYDRVKDSPGANDNSIAVFHLLKAASLLPGSSPWMIVFTDKEELSPGESLKEQGSYSLAEKLKSWGLEKTKVYNFDACGAGGALIISTTTDLILKDSESEYMRLVRKNIKLMRDHAFNTASLLQFDKVMFAPTPFSDDIGFLRAGLASQTITMLPENEARQYEELLRSRDDFADLLLSGGLRSQSERRLLPETWRSLNSPSDSPSRLTPVHFEQTVRFIVQLTKSG
ncbi:MAG: Zn-dependent exopeptidase M28 [Treponema sp.]|nr:Zn-dependent exopeptidase M28 [Treponema sp.]